MAITIDENDFKRLEKILNGIESFLVDMSTVKTTIKTNQFDKSESKYDVWTNYKNPLKVKFYIREGWIANGNKEVEKYIEEIYNLLAEELFILPILPQIGFVIEIASFLRGKISNDAESWLEDVSDLGIKYITVYSEYVELDLVYPA